MWRVCTAHADKPAVGAWVYESVLGCACVQPLGGQRNMYLTPKMGVNIASEISVQSKRGGLFKF